MGLLQWNTQFHPHHCSPPYPAVDCGVDNADDDGGVAAGAVGVAVAAVVVSSEALVVNSDYMV